MRLANSIKLVVIHFHNKVVTEHKTTLNKEEPNRNLFLAYPDSLESDAPPLTF